MILGNIFAVKRKGLSSFISFMATFFFKKKKNLEEQKQEES
jgi:hypothetical protein